MRTKKRSVAPVCPSHEESIPSTPLVDTPQGKLTLSEGSTQSDSATLRKGTDSAEESEATVMDDQGSDDDGMEEVRRSYEREAAKEAVGTHDDHITEEDFEEELQEELEEEVPKPPET